MIRSIAAAAACLWAAGGGAGNVTSYYVDAVKGSDANAGTAPGAAWRTVGKLNGARLRAGARVLFAAGQVHHGTVTVRGVSGVTLASFGEGRATIDGGEVDGISAEEVEGLTISRLAVAGAGRKTGNRTGRGVVLRKARKALVEDVDATGFLKAGILVQDSDDVRVTGCVAHDNGFAGILVRGSRHVRVDRCRALNNPGDPTILDNHSGNGILVGASADCVVEECEAAGNGWDQPKGGQGNGPVGIWCHDAERIVIRRCIAHHNMSTSGDGGGFDFDGGTRDSVLEDNYSYQNWSSGYLIWEYGSEFPIRHNVIRRNISVDDGEAGIRMGISGGTPITDLLIERNTIVNRRHPCVLTQGSWASGTFDAAGGLNGVVVRDNILVGPKDGPVVQAEGKIRFEGNAYWSFDKAFRAGGADSLEAWAKATGQESAGGKPLGLFGDPGLADHALIPQLTDPARLADLAPFRPKPGSPAASRKLGALD